MLSAISQAILARSAQASIGLLVPAVQHARGTLLNNVACFATNSKASPPYLKASKEEKTGKKKAAIPRALSAYAFYVKEQASGRKGTPGVAGSLMKELAAEWNLLTEKQKLPYTKQAQESKAKSADARQKAKADRAPPSAYNSWCREVSLMLGASHPQLTAPQRLQEAAARWRAMDEDEKQRRTEEAQQAKELWKQQKSQS